MKVLRGLSHYVVHFCQLNIFRERELLYDLFEVATGMRMMHNYFHTEGHDSGCPRASGQSYTIKGPLVI